MLLTDEHLTKRYFGMKSISSSIKLRDILVELRPFSPDIVGEVKALIRHVGSLQHSQESGCLSFCKLEGDKADAAISASKADVIICHRNNFRPHPGKTLILVDNPRLAFMRVISNFFLPQGQPSIHPSAIISPNAEIGENVSIGAQCYIGNAIIGSGTILSEGVIILDGTKIGRNVRIAPGSVIGSDGFGYERNENGELEKFPHIGGVVIEDFVEIGSNTCIDRGTLDDTRIRARAKIDNLVHIAHNVDVGEDVAVIALSIVGGGSRIGKKSWVAPSAVIRNQLSIGENATVGLGAVVTKDVAASATVLGNPARELDEFKKMMEAMSLLLRQGS